MKNRWLIPTILIGISVVGVFVSLCGLGLFMGFKTVSLIGFFGALGVLGMLRLVGWYSKANDDAAS